MATEIPDFNELYALAKAQALLSTDKLSDLSWSPGYMVDIATGMPAALGEEIARIALELHAKHYFSQAEGDDLDTLASDHFGLSRNEGASAVGTVRFSRASASFGNVSIPAGTIVETGDGLQFVTTGGALMTGLQIDVNIAAVVAGQEGIVSSGTIVVINSTTALADSSIQVTNPSPTAGGMAEETDAQFVSRILGWFRTLRRGTGLALETGGKWIPGVVVANVDESAYPPTVYIADVTGAANNALEIAVAAELVNWRSAGIQVNVVGATLVYQNVNVSLTFEAGYDTAELRDLVEAAIRAEISSLGIGPTLGTLYSAAIVKAAVAIDGVLNCVVNDPVGDVVPDPDQLIRPGTVTYS